MATVPTGEEDDSVKGLQILAEGDRRSCCHLCVKGRKFATRPLVAYFLRKVHLREYLFMPASY